MTSLQILASIELARQGALDVTLPIEIIQWVLIFFNVTQLCSYLQLSKRTLNDLVTEIPHPDCRQKFICKIFDLASTPRDAPFKFFSYYSKFLKSALGKFRLTTETSSSFVVLMLQYDQLGFFYRLRFHPQVVTYYSPSLGPLLTLACRCPTEKLAINFIHLYCSLRGFSTYLSLDFHRPAFYSTRQGGLVPVLHLISKPDHMGLFSINYTNPTIFNNSPILFMTMCIEAINLVTLCRYHNALVVASEAVVLKVEGPFDKNMRNAIQTLKLEMMKQLTILTAHLVNDPDTCFVFFDTTLSLSRPINVPQLVLCLQYTYLELEWFEAGRKLFFSFFKNNTSSFSLNYAKAIVNHLHIILDYSVKLNIFLTAYCIHYQHLGKIEHLFDRVKRFKNVLTLLCSCIQEGKELLDMLHSVWQENKSFLFVLKAYNFSSIKLGLLEHLTDKIIFQRFPFKPNMYVSSPGFLHESVLGNQCKAYIENSFTGVYRIEIDLFEQYSTWTSTRIKENMHKTDTVLNSRIGLKYSKSAAKLWLLQGLLCLHKMNDEEPGPTMFGNVNPFQKALEHFSHIPNGSSLASSKVASFVASVLSHKGMEKMAPVHFADVKQSLVQTISFASLEQKLFSLLSSETNHLALNVDVPFQTIHDILKVNRHLDTMYCLGFS